MHRELRSWAMGFHIGVEDTEYCVCDPTLARTIILITDTGGDCSSAGLFDGSRPKFDKNLLSAGLSRGCELWLLHCEIAIRTVSNPKPQPIVFVESTREIKLGEMDFDIPLPPGIIYRIQKC